MSEAPKTGRVRVPATPAPARATAEQAACTHMNFKAQVDVTRLTETDDGPVTGYTTDISVKCAECGLPFRFMGLLAGSHYAEPRVSIEPAYTLELAGHPLIAGTA